MTALAEHYRSDYHEQVGMAEAVRRAFSNYANFSGRANRGEFWWWVLANIIIGTVLSLISYVTGIGFLSLIWTLATLIPGWALNVRRLHDIDRSGWWLLIGLVPIIGLILLIVWAATKGDSQPNRFG